MRLTAAVMGVTLLAATTAFGAGVKTYQVTGPVLEVKEDRIVVQKGSEKWEIARDKETKVSGDLKVGSKVTVMYSMKATDIKAKGEETGKKKK